MQHACIVFGANRFCCEPAGPIKGNGSVVVLVGAGTARLALTKALFNLREGKSVQGGVTT